VNSLTLTSDHILVAFLTELTSGITWQFQQGKEGGGTCAVIWDNRSFCHYLQLILVKLLTLFLSTRVSCQTTVTLGNLRFCPHQPTDPFLSIPQIAAKDKRSWKCAYSSASHQGCCVKHEISPPSYRPALPQPQVPALLSPSVLGTFQLKNSTLGWREGRGDGGTMTTRSEHRGYLFGSLGARCGCAHM
jgi:hypothetical protein